MPSGAKKRKTSKRPKPKGDSGPELEAGPEEAMEDNGVEVGDGSPSPRVIEGESETLADRGLEATGDNGKSPEERDDESEALIKDLQTDEAAADDQVDPPSQADPNSEIPAGIMAEAPVVIEPEQEPVQEERKPQTMEEPAQNETEPQIDPALRDHEEKADSFVEDNEPETQMDVVPTDLEAVTDVTPATSADEIKPDADELKEEPVQEEKEPHVMEDPAQNETEAQMDPALRDDEAKVDSFVEDIKPETQMDVVPTNLEAVTDVTPATSADEIKPDADDGVDEVQSSEESGTVERGSVYEAGLIGNESGIDESPVETKVDAPPSDDLAPVIGDVEVMGIPSAEAESEGHEPQVEVKSEAYTTPIELETSNASNKIPAEAEQEVDGVLAESKTGVEEAAPLETKPDTEEGPTMERELETHVTPAVTDREGVPDKEIALDAQPDMAAAPADTVAETDYAGQVIDTSSDGISPDVGTSLYENPPEADTYPDRLPLEASVASLEKERNEAELDENAEPFGAEQDEVSGAEIQAPPALEPDAEVLKREVPEENTEGGETFAEPEAKPELPLEAETESKPQDVTEDTSLEDLPEIESEAKVDAIDEAKAEDEAFVKTKADEGGPVQSDVVEEVKAVPENEPEPEVEASRGIELEGETVDTEPEPEVGPFRGMEVEAGMVDPEPEPEVETSRGIDLKSEMVDGEPEPVAEASVDHEPVERGQSETHSGQPDLVQMECDQSGDQKLEKQEEEEGVGELATSIPEVGQSSESEACVADASEVPEIESEPTAISTLDDVNIADDSTSSVSSGNSSDHGEAGKTAIKAELDSRDDMPPSATALGDEGEGSVSDYNQDFSVENIQARGVAGDVEKGAADEIREESKEDIDRQDGAVDARHDEVKGSLTSARGGDGTEKASEQELATIELPPAAIADSATENIGDQERTVDVGLDGDGALPGSAGKSAEVEEQESGVEVSPTDAFTEEEFAKEGSPPSDSEQVTEQHHPIDEEDMSAAGDEPPRVESEQNLKATIPLESEMFSDAPAPQEDAFTPATHEKVASEREFPLESACGELEKDIGEEEAASSTVAEAGSVINDLDERASYQRDLLPVDITSINQDMDTSDSKESDGNALLEDPEFFGTGLREPVDVESTEAAKPAEAVRLASPEKASSDEESSFLRPEQVVQDGGQDNICPSKEDELGNKGLKADNVEERAQLEDDKAGASSIVGSALPVFSGDELISKALQYLGNGPVDVESTDTAKPAEVVRSAFPEKASSDEQSPLLQPEQAVQDSGQDDICSSKEEILGSKQLKADGEQRAKSEEDKAAANSILGSGLPVFSGDELISKAFTYLGDSQQSMPSPGGLGIEHRDECSAHSEANDAEKTGILAMETRELKEADLHKPLGVDTNIDADKSLGEPPSPIAEDRGIKEVQAFRQETTNEASQPVEVPIEDRGLEQVNVKGTEQQRRGSGTVVEGRRKMLGCCGLFDVLLGKN